MSEAAARHKIDQLLESAGWRFFDDDNGRANIRLEAHVALKRDDLDSLGDNFERSGRGFVDFLLIDDRGFPLIVLEAKSEDKDPLVGKEQARRYARSLNCRFVILSNGNLHYFWDLERGNPHIITAFPSPDSVEGYKQVEPNSQRLIDEQVGDDYIVLTQRPSYAAEAGWRNEAERSGYIQTHGLRFLRDYQLRAIHRLQRAVRDGRDRFLFEMATGTGKTLVAAAVIKLFLRTGNARRVLFLVDRLELEDQAASKSFVPYLANDFDTVIYKEKRDDWRRAHIVVHDRSVAAVQQQVPVAVFADGLRLGDFGRGAPVHQRQRPCCVRLLRRLQAGTDCDAPRLPQRHPSDRPACARPARGGAAGCCSTPTALLAARVASRRSATRCSTG